MSETPRVDMVARMVPDADKINGRFVYLGHATELVSAEFARQLERELAQAQARCAEVEKDAARYRFVRKNAYVAGNGWMFAGAYKTIDPYAFNLKSKAALDDCDAAIDRAIAALKEPRS